MKLFATLAAIPISLASLSIAVEVCTPDYDLAITQHDWTQGDKNGYLSEVGVNLGAALVVRYFLCASYRL